MKILLRSGTVITTDLEDLSTWKEKMGDPDVLITYSTDTDGLIIFRGSEMAEIRIEKDEVAKSMIS